MVALVGGAQQLARGVAVEQARGDRHVVGHAIRGAAQCGLQLRLLGFVQSRASRPGACQASSGGGATTATSANRARYTCAIAIAWSSANSASLDPSNATRTWR